VTITDMVVNHFNYQRSRSCSYINIQHKNGENVLPVFTVKPARDNKIHKIVSVVRKLEIVVGLVLCYFVYSFFIELRLKSGYVNILRYKVNIIDGLSHRGQENEVALGEEFHIGVLNKKINDTDEAITDQISTIQTDIRNWHYGMVQKQFGSQTPKVEVKILNGDKISSFVVEMAPVELMPNSIHFFLEMVKANVWQNTVFTHVDHILYAVLTNTEGRHKVNNLPEIQASRLLHSEYSPDYPHYKYTIGFSGGLGAPEFYINTDDNRKIHGPGGQHKDDTGDACFGKVIKGFDVIDRMVKRTEKPFDSDFVETVIHSITILQ